MANQFSSDAGFSVDNAAGTLTDISGYVNNLTVSGGNELVDDTGLGDSVRHEATGISPVNEMSITAFVNSTTEAIFAPLVNGTSVAKTVQAQVISGQYISGESNVATVSFSVPIGLQTVTATFRSSDASGFSRTSVAL